MYDMQTLHAGGIPMFRGTYLVGIAIRQYCDGPIMNTMRSCTGMDIFLCFGIFSYVMFGVVCWLLFFNMLGFVS